MIEIKFVGEAAEVRREMEILLGRGSVPAPLREMALAIAEQTAPVIEQTVDQQVEAAFGETKRGRGRPKKVESVAKEKEVMTPEEVIEEEEKEKAELKELIESVTLTIDPEPEPVAEQASSPVPSNAQDLMTATMDLVKGDSAKKIALVKLLGSYGAKTINTLAAEHYPEFWEKVNAL